MKYKHLDFLCYFWLQEKTAQIKSIIVLIYPREGVLQVEVEPTILSAVQACFCESSNLPTSSHADDESSRVWGGWGVGGGGYTFENHNFTRNGHLKSERAAVPSLASNVSSFSLGFFSSLSSGLLSRHPVRPLQVPRYLPANTGIHEPCTSAALWKRKPLCRSSRKAPSIVLCVPRGDEGVLPLEERAL